LDTTPHWRGFCSTDPTLLCLLRHILLNEPYNKIKRKGQKLYKSSLDGTGYAINQIDWFILQGKPVVEGKPITRRYSRIVSVENPNKVWKDKIVISRLPGRLPQSLAEGGTQLVFKAVSDLQSHILDSRAEGGDQTTQALV
jgi:hypothetical protein